MNTDFLSKYLKQLQSSIDKGDAREESFYGHLREMLLAFAETNNNKGIDITILPKATEAGNPDFRVWNGKHKITGYIEAKAPSVMYLDSVSVSEQLKRYLGVFPNVILTNFYEFRLYQDGQFVCMATIASSFQALNLKSAPPLQKAEELIKLLERYFSFSLPAITTPKALAVELAKRTRFLRDEVISLEIAEEQKQGKKVLLGFYESFKKLLINNLTQEQFADLYAQTLTYGIFAARTKATGEFNRELIYKYIPGTLGVLKSIFKFISYEEPPKAMEVLIDDIAEVLCVTDIQTILHTYYKEGKGSDPIIHFYETFLTEYDPELRKKQGVYYTPESVVHYIVKSIHSILKTHFNLADGLADSSVTLLDPAAGTLTFPAEAIKIAVQEHSEKYGTGSVHQFIKNHILPHFYALELMMAPYTVGHLKISYLLNELGYEMEGDERFKLYLTNTLEQDLPPQLNIPFTHEITEECELANQVKQNEPVLVILGNPPYNGKSENVNKWTEQLLKQDMDGAQSYFKVDEQPLGERNPKMLQDDYVKFIRFAQWKIHKAGKGVVGMVTNHSYIDNVTFKGMRQSLLNTFDEIFILDLHGSSQKQRKCQNGSKDENVFYIKQGVSIILMIKSKLSKKGVYHKDLLGVRAEKYSWLDNAMFEQKNYTSIYPNKPFYMFKPISQDNEHYHCWLQITDIFPIKSVGIVTSRDEVAINRSKHLLMNSLLAFSKIDIETAKIRYKLKTNSTVNSFIKAQKYLINSDISYNNVKTILYRPFDTRYIYYPVSTNDFLERPRLEVMQHMLHENLGLVCNRAVKIDFSHVLICSQVTDYHVLETANADAYIFPLRLSSSTNEEDLFHDQEEPYNISQSVLKMLSNSNTPIDVFFYYIYGILYSTIYRIKYSEHLKMDFPRIPITKDNKLLLQMSEYGKAIAEFHLMKSEELNPPIAKYQGTGDNDLVKQVSYDETLGQIRINEDKYFEGILPEVWNYHIGGYQVLHKYLKDRKDMRLEDPVHYCRIVTALSKTIEYQRKIDSIYEEVEASVLK